MPARRRHHRPRRGQVAVVTGAASGIARCAAEAFAEHGVRLVLADRDEAGLAAAVAACRAHGVQCVAAPADLADAVAVESVLGTALRRFGHVDIWVNAAAELHVGPFDREGPADVDRLLGANVAGYVHGSRVALQQFRAQGNGSLINVGSLLGVTTNPMACLYVTTKHAVTGLTRTLRLAMASHRHIGVSLVLPPSVDTPMFRRVGPVGERPVRAIAPAVAPERVAATIVRCAQRPRRQVTVGLSGRLILAGARISPPLTDALVGRWSAALLLAPARPEQPCPDGAAVDTGTSPPHCDGPAAGSVDRAHGGFRRGGGLRRAAGAWWARSIGP